MTASPAALLQRDVDRQVHDDDEAASSMSAGDSRALSSRQHDRDNRRIPHTVRGPASIAHHIAFYSFTDTEKKVTSLYVKYISNIAISLALKVVSQ